jgi:hypothetical protein
MGNVIGNARINICFQQDTLTPRKRFLKLG